jgi:hypothetical protein
MARRKTRPDRVGNALQHVLQRIDPERRLELFRVWSAEVGPAIASRAQPTAFRDGILSVRVSTAAWMQELQFAKEDIRQRLNQRLGTEAVRDVYFVAGARIRGRARRRSSFTQPMTSPKIRSIFRRCVMYDSARSSRASHARINGARGVSRGVLDPWSPCHPR